MKTKNIEKFNTLTQRQKKFAKTKIALLNSLLEELETKELSTIMIKELAQMAEVSEPTFFNYFDSKQHMLVYFIQMWSIEMHEIAIVCQNETSSSLDAIKKIFIKTAEQISVHPQIMLEIIAFQTRDMKLKPHDISDGEKWLFFEDIEDVELIEGMGLESILPPLISQAIKNGELKMETDAKLLFLMLSSLFFGTSLLTVKRDAKILPHVFEAELNLIFEKVKS